MKKHCLIVDDDVMTRFIMKAILEEFFTCDMADSGETALEAFEQANARSERYSLICLDVNMPGMSGLTVLKQIRETELALGPALDRETKVIIVSADSTSATVLKSFFECGASSYVTKPVGKQKMVETLKTLAVI